MVRRGRVRARVEQGDGNIENSFAADPLDASRNSRAQRKQKTTRLKPLKNFLTFTSENSFAVTLVSRLAQFYDHFFLDFIFL
jgi:hypothetical protein